jgi:hypothetical protein
VRPPRQNRKGDYKDEGNETKSLKKQDRWEWSKQRKQFMLEMTQILSHFSL